MSGIAFAGSILVDKINSIAAYPAAGQLTKILGLKSAVGGCVPNCAIDMKTLAPETPVFAVGKVGADAEGHFVCEQLGAAGVDCTGVRTDPAGRTSFTDVMSVVGGQRTFFTYAGASADFGIADVDFAALQARGVDMFHLGYFLLLDRVDAGEGVGILRAAKEHGMRTSIDLVSENSDRYRLVLPCLRYTDNLIINETEAGQLAGMDPQVKNLRAICEALLSLGVQQRVIIHMKDRAVCLSRDGYVCTPAYDVPRSCIKGTTGAGDAFCSGALLGIARGVSDGEILDMASVSAIGALSAEDAVSGMRSLDTLRAVAQTYGKGRLDA